MKLPKEMQAVIFEKIGTHKLVTMPVPKIREPEELLVKIEAASICGSDLHILADPPGCVALPGTVIGHEMVGEVVEIGGAVTGFRLGDPLVCDPNISCGHCEACRTGYKNMCENLHIHGVDRHGFFSQYACIPESSAIKISPALSLEVILDPFA